MNVLLGYFLPLIVQFCGIIFLAAAVELLTDWRINLILAGFD
jgi:hypothetical protein